MTRTCTGRRARHVSPRGLLAVTCLGYFLVLLDVTVVNVALPRIGSELGTSVSGLQWVVDGYALALAALMLAGGTLGDLHGHRRVVLVGFTVFGIGSLGAGTAPNLTVLVTARVVQGMGAALLLPGTLAIVSRAFLDAPARARAIGIWAGVGSLALPSGPLLGGALVDAAGWRAIFLINVPVVLLSLIAARAVLPRGTRSRGRSLDTGGVVLGTLVLLAATLALIEAGRTGLEASVVLTAGAAAVALLAAFLMVEAARGESAILPLRLFRRPPFATANAAAGTMNLCTLGTLFVLTLYLQSVRGQSPLTAGLAMLPLFLPLAAVAPLSGRLTGRIGPRLPMALGLAIAAAGLALLVGAEPGSSYLLLVPAFLLWGVGLGILTPAVVAAAIAAVPRDREGLAAGINNTARQAGGAIGVALAGGIAGAPGPGFLHGFHEVAAGGACLYLIAAAAALAFIPGTPRFAAYSGQDTDPAVS